MINKMDNIKQLLKKAFEAGIDRNHYNFNLVAGTLDKDDYAPNFDEWLQYKLKNNGDLGDVSGSFKLTFEQCLNEEFLINTQNYPKEYHHLFNEKFNRAKKRFEQQ
jgi:hypothetical protein